MGPILKIQISGALTPSETPKFSLKGLLLEEFSANFHDQKKPFSNNYNTFGFLYLEKQIIILYSNSLSNIVDILAK